MLKLLSRKRKSFEGLSFGGAEDVSYRFPLSALAPETECFTDFEEVTEEYLDEETSTFSSFLKTRLGRRLIVH